MEEVEEAATRDLQREHHLGDSVGAAAVDELLCEPTRVLVTLSRRDDARAAAMGAGDHRPAMMINRKRR